MPLCTSQVAPSLTNYDWLVLLGSPMQGGSDKCHVSPEQVCFQMDDTIFECLLLTKIFSMHNLSSGERHFQVHLWWLSETLLVSGKSSKSGLPQFGLTLPFAKINSPAPPPWSQTYSANISPPALFMCQWTGSPWAPAWVPARGLLAYRSFLRRSRWVQAIIGFREMGNSYFY